MKNLESGKRKEIENFRNYDRIYNIERVIQQTRTAFHDAKRQQKAMEVKISFSGHFDTTRLENTGQLQAARNRCAGKQ